MNTNNPHKYLVILTAASFTRSIKDWFWLDEECRKRGITLLCLSNNGKYLVPVRCIPGEVLELRIKCALEWREMLSKKAIENAKAKLKFLKRNC